MILSLFLAAAMLAWSSGQAYAAPNNGKKPILTKSGKKAALTQATAALFAEPTTQALPLVNPPPDIPGVPHYFGPWPNWANSPFTLPDVTVTIDPPAAGTQATATATVDADGAVTGFTITDPGSGYAVEPLVTISGSGTGATATATVFPTGVVTAVTIDIPGSGYTAPTVQFTGGDGDPGFASAEATAYGGVDGAIVTDQGNGAYTFPTVEFGLPDHPDGVKAVGHIEYALGTTDMVIVVDQPGSGYSTAPVVIIRDGTIYDPINNGGFGATATASLALQTVVMTNFGANYLSVPTVTILDPTGIDATATAFTDFGAVTGLTLTNPGTGYITGGGMEKFVDGLPQLCIPTANYSECDAVANNLGQYLPVAVPDTTTFPGTDFYVIALVQKRECMSSSLPGCGPLDPPGGGTLQRMYVQLQTPANESFSRNGSVALNNDMLDGTPVPALMPDGSPAIGVDDPHFLGPVIVSQKDRPVRVLFYNLLPGGTDGDLFLPKDSTIMGSGYGPLTPFPNEADQGTVYDSIRNPLCTFDPSNPACFIDSRATLHLHGGITPWISDGTPHQWITPANEPTPWPEGVSVGNVPDMARPDLGVPDCTAPGDGCSTFYWTNQQSARLMFYHDHAWGITRLNVYAGEAAGYLIADPTEQALTENNIIPADQIPLVIQDRTFVPGDAQLAEQDPNWDISRWGGPGNLWYHHVYMPAQNPGDPSGMSAYGRWMFGPWFWPPATPPHGPIDNPYYDPACNLNDPATWQYGTDPFCEPQLIPGTPNISAGMEQFNDTPIVNGTAYPTLTVEPKAYRLRILNAANDRFFNLSLYEADPGSARTDLNGAGTAIGPTEVALNAAEVAAAQLDPNIFPTPDTSPGFSPPGPNWIVIGTEGGFLPTPVVVPPQPTTWIIDPTVFNVGNVDQHSLLVAPAERFDVIVDFSKYAGKTLILYNDAPAAFPARVSTYDYYTGAPDQYPIGAPATLPGYGPNTRTVMQIKVAADVTGGTGPAPAFSLANLNAAFTHRVDVPSVFEQGQHPIIVGQAGYDSAYGTNFAAGGYCNGGSTSTLCDGYLRIADQGATLFGFNTLLAPTEKMLLPIEPKAIHDEMNSSAFDEFGRMQANIGIEATPATPAGQNVTLYPYVNPPTEMYDGTNLPKNDVSMTPISPISSADGSQIWKITHNGVDTHPLHWHLYDVQVLNRVTWDNIVSPPDPTELGWKDTLRVSPLEDTIVAIRPIIPYLPFELPNSVRPLHPMIPLGVTLGFNNIDPNGNPTIPIVNQLVNFGTEYVWHCHILSHEEMDMMRPVSVALPPNAPTGLAYTISGTGGNQTLQLTWNDNSLNETQFLVQRDAGSGWVDIGTVLSPLSFENTKGPVSFTDPTYDRRAVYLYRVLAQNTVGYGAEFPSVTAQSISNVVQKGTVPAAVPAAPTGLTATAQAAGPQVLLTWTDNATTETGFVIERSDNGGAFVQLVTVGPRNNTGTVSYTDPAVLIGNTYDYRVSAVNLAGSSAPSNIATAAFANVPAAPAFATATGARQGNGPNDRVTVTWPDVATETGYTIQMATNTAFTANLVTSTVGANVTTFTSGNVPRFTPFYFRVQAFNGSGPSAWTNAAPFPIDTP